MCCFWVKICPQFDKFSAEIQFRNIDPLMPAERHLETASGTAARGGSIMDMRPTKRRPSMGKLTSSELNGNPGGNWDSGSSRSQKPRTRSPSPPWGQSCWGIVFLGDFDLISAILTDLLGGNNGDSASMSRI
jgi:hypothetical protein